MPNTASKYGQGITALYNSSFKKSNFKKVSSIFSKLGTVIEVDNDSKIDTFTGVIGSGPAYFFQTLKSFEKKLMRLCNQDEKIVREIIANLMKGVGLSIEKDGDLDNLIKAVASKKGTTEAWLKSLKSNNLNSTFFNDEYFNLFLSIITLDTSQAMKVSAYETKFLPILKSPQPKSTKVAGRFLDKK